MDFKTISNYVVESIKQRERRNKAEAEKAKVSPYEYRFFRPIEFEVDHKYLAEVIEEALSCGMLNVPQTEKELSDFEMDIYTNFIQEDVFPSKVTFVRDNKNSYYSKPTLVRMIETHKQNNDKVFPYPEFRLKMNLGEMLQASDEKLDEEISNGVYCGCGKYAKGYKYFGNKEMSTWFFDMHNANFPFSKYYFEKSKWIRGKVNIHLTIPSSIELNAENLNRIFEILELAKHESNFDLGEVTISFDQQKIDSDKTRYRYSNLTLNSLEYLSKYVEKIGGKVTFSEFNTSFNTTKPKWTFDQLKKANDCIDELAKTIRDNKLSPFEAVLYISAWCSKNLVYHNDCNDLELNNTILSAVNTKLVRCVGFSEFINAVLNSVGYNQAKGGDSLVAEKISCTTEKDSNGNILPNHCQSLIFINDEKYGISGNYLCDANAVNFVGILTEQINAILSGLQNGVKNIKPFNSLCLKNLDEMRAIIPDYTIFPYSPTDEVEVQLDRQISMGDINKLLRIQNSLERKNPNEIDDYLKQNNINFSVKPVNVGGVAYDEYYKQSKTFMKGLKSAQGKAIPAKKFNDAYLRILQLLYPELVHDEESFTVAMSGINLLNATISNFVKESFEANQMDI